MPTPTPGQLRIAAVQQARGEDLDRNMRDTQTAIREAAVAGARLIVLQELHRSRYFCQSEDDACFDLAEAIPGPSSELLGALAKELGVVIVASLFERRAAGLYHNTAVVLDGGRDGVIAGRYRKMHIPDDPGYYEKFYFTPGDPGSGGDGEPGFAPIDTSIGKLGVLICWDQWYPEAARLMALAGAEILIYPTAIGWDTRDRDAERARQLDAWITVQRAHAVANGLPLISCNRTGHEPDPSGRTAGIEFWGNSFVCGPQGEILAQAAANKPQTLYADLDMQRGEQVRRVWPFLRDRRIDAYQDLNRRYRD